MSAPGGMRLALAALLCALAPSSVAGAEDGPRRLVVLTFDDAARSHFTVVRPLLLELGFSATFFVTEGFDFPTNKRDYMSWSQIAQLAEDGFEIGNHTRDHLPVTPATRDRLAEQIEAIQEKCRRYGIPEPTSFAYPENAFDPGALPILAAAGFRFARRGGAPERPYDGGRGVLYEPGRDHPLLLPSAGDARPSWSIDDFRAALGELDREHGADRIPILQFHGVPDRQHPWVSTPAHRFRGYMEYLAEAEYEVLALRDLARFVPPWDDVRDPAAILRVRLAESKPEP